MVRRQRREKYKQDEIKISLNFIPAELTLPQSMRKAPSLLSLSADRWSRWGWGTTVSFRWSAPCRSDNLWDEYKTALLYTCIQHIHTNYIALQVKLQTETIQTLKSDIPLFKICLHCIIILHNSGYYKCLKVKVDVRLFSHFLIHL